MKKPIQYEERYVFRNGNLVAHTVDLPQNSEVQEIVRGLRKDLNDSKVSNFVAVTQEQMIILLQDQRLIPRKESLDAKILKFMARTSFDYPYNSAKEPFYHLLYS